MATMSGKDEQEHQTSGRKRSAPPPMDESHASDEERRLNEMLESPEKRQRLLKSPEKRQRLLELFQETEDTQETKDTGKDLSTPSQRNIKREDGRREDLAVKYESCGDSDTPVDLLDNKLKDIIQEHKEARGESDDTSTIAAPFLCVLQSTGCGKTRAILELAKTRRKLVYLIMKPDTHNDGSWQVPSVIQQVKDRTDDAEEEICEKIWSKFFDALKECVTQEKYNSREKLYKAQITPEMALGEFYNDLEKSWRKVTTPDFSRVRPALKPGNNSPSSSLDMQSAGQNSDSDHSPQSKKVRFLYTNAAPITEESLTVCFDEVSALKENSFRALRRTAKHAGILAVYTDTAASICQVMNPNDHSSSTKGGTLGNFGAPLFQWNTNDLLWSMDSEKYDDYENLFSAGRPRWRSHIDLCKRAFKTAESPATKAIESLINLATNLLSREKGDMLDNQETNELTVRSFPKLTRVKPGMLALFLCRFSLGPRSKLSKLLVKHSLATVIGVSEDREVVCSSYPSEPVLAEASSRFTQNEKNLNTVLDNIEAAFHNNNKLLDPPRGDLGEMCAAAILGYAMDHVRKKKNHEYMSQTVKLGDFLSLFVDGEDGLPNNEMNSMAENWSINVTHFIRPSWAPSGKDLKIMWQRRMGYYVPGGAPGLDLLIAIQDDSTKQYGTLRVQVKNYTDTICKSTREKFLERLRPWKCPPSVENEGLSVSLLLSVNDIDKCCRVLRNSKLSKAEPPVLQIATCFPTAADSPLIAVSKKLKNICTQNTSQYVDCDLPACEEVIRRSLFDD